MALTRIKTDQISNGTITGDDVNANFDLSNVNLGNLTSTGIDDNSTVITITIDSADNVGIGEPSPTEKLEVSGNIKATSFIGSLSGNATTASAWETPRTITLTGPITGSVSIDGSGDVSITTSVSADSVNLGTDTTGNYVDDVTAGNYIIKTGTAGEGWSPTIAVDATSDNTASKVVARDVSGNFSAGTITADLSGNATTASTLETSRSIELSGDISGSAFFDGSSNITITTTIQPNSVALGTDTTGNYMIDVSAGSGISISHTQSEGSTATITHADTSSVSNLSSDNIDGTVLQDISVTFDEFGHVSTATVGTVNLDDRYYTETEVDTNFVNVSGDTLTGFLNLHASPTSALHAATKQYVDEVAQGLQALPSAKGATTANLTATYDNGTSGVGATLTATANGAFPTIDGVSYSLNDNILVKDQTNGFENGSYVLTTVGDGSNPWVLTRCSFCDEPNEVTGAFEFVTEGTVNGGTGWVIIVDSPVTIGTTNLNWTQFSGAGTYTAGTGLDLNGTQFAHADTSSVANVDNSNNTFIQDLTFDEFGHVTAVSSGSVTVGDGSLTVNTSGTGLSGSGTFSANQSTNNTITITSNATSSNNASTIVARDSSGNFSAGTITAALSGNASTATTLQTARTISLTGDVTGSVSFNGSSNVSINATVADDSHNHVISNVDGLQDALDAKLASSSYTASDVLSKLLTVDGAGSGLDADTIDGLQASSFMREYGTGVQSNINTISVTSGKYRWNNTTNGRPADSQANEYGTLLNLNYDGTQSTQLAHEIYEENLYFRTLNTGTDTGTAWKRVLTTSDEGSGNGLDADTVDGIQGSSIVQTSRTISTGSGLTGGGNLTANRTISHADTSSQGSVNNSGGTVIQDVTLDGFGHVTGLASVNLDERYYESVYGGVYTTKSASDVGYTASSASGRFNHLRGGLGVAAVTFQQALADAANKGVRLPTLDELEDELVRGTGGGFDSEICWTCTPVPGRSGYVYAKLGTGGGARLELPTDGTQTAYTRYVANVDVPIPFKANQWTTARTLSLSGDASGSVSIDGSSNVTLSVTVANDSHTHDARYYTESEADSRFFNVSGDTINVGRGNVYVENNSSDNQNGAGITIRTSNNPSSGSEGSVGAIFAVRSSGQAARLWVGQSETTTGSNHFVAPSAEINGNLTANSLTVGGSAVAPPPLFSLF